MTIKIFISYRRSDSRAITGRIFDRLLEYYGPNSVFIDIDNIPPGIDFRDYVRQEFQASDLLLVMIGQQWFVTAENGVARIHSEDDPVRVEIELGLERGTPILPILVDGARMPKASELPKNIANLAYINAIEVHSDRDFNIHLHRMVLGIDDILRRSGKQSFFSISRRQIRKPLYLKNSRVLFWTLAAILLIIPAAAGFASLAPPSPSTTVSILVTTGIVGATFAVVHSQMRTISAARWSLLRCAASSLVLFIGIYFLSISVLTFVPPNSIERIAKGYECRPEALLVYKQKCPLLSTDDVKEANWVADRLWTTSSIGIVTVGLWTVWISMFLSLAITAACLLQLVTQKRLST
jgi:hypothetical protein